MSRYTIVERKRRRFKFTLVDNEHPSGVSGYAVRSFHTLEEAQKYYPDATLEKEN